MLRESLRRSLIDEGFDVLGEAGDGQQAVDLTQKLGPDVVLMDVTMPVLDGVEATQRIRELCPEVQVVMLTMHANADVIVRAIRSGASGYLVKDCSMDDIADAVRLVANGDTALSPQLAAAMLGELRKPDGPPATDDGRVITKREEQVLQLICEGLSTPELADKLCITPKTVRNHLQSIYQKLHARDRTEAVVRAVRMGIIRLD